MSTGVPALQIDIIGESLSNGLVVLFTQSTSRTYGLAVNLAKSADKYTESLLGKSLYHIAIFQKKRESLARAAALLNLVADWKGCQVFAGGKVMHVPDDFLDVLKCYMIGSALDDNRAHCHKVFNHPDTEMRVEAIATLAIAAMDGENDDYGIPKTIDVEQLISPCQFIHHWLELESSHPSKIKDQIKAKAIEKGSDWCPFFSADNFRSLNKTVRIEA